MRAAREAAAEHGLTPAVLEPQPIALSAGQPGRDVLPPIAVVILAGLPNNTLLRQVVMPTHSLLVGRHR